MQGHAFAYQDVVKLALAKQGVLGLSRFGRQATAC
jgi:hypothetical protein